MQHASGRRARAAMLCLTFASMLFLGKPSRATVEEVPFVTTPDNVTLAMLRLAKVGPRDYVIDLGSGDGRIVIVAAKMFGARGLGVEIVPELVSKSRQNARRAGVDARAQFHEQDLYQTDLTPASVVTLYLLPEVNLQLRPALLALKPGTRVVSHDWDMGDWKPDRTITLAAPEKKIGREKLSRVHLWIVPARVDGAWCGVGKQRGTTLLFAQRFQQFEANLTTASQVRSFDGDIDGATLRSSPSGEALIGLALRGERLRVTRARGPLSWLRETSFARRSGETCA
jgi:SAM-dependent methyltransferase